MAQLFVANGTHQHQEFMYRVIENPTVRRLQIPAGRQVAFPEDYSDGHHLQHVIKQLERYGAVEDSSVGHITRPRSLVYSVSNKPISSDKINAAREIDEIVRQEVSAKATEDSGLALLATASARVNSDAIKATSLEVTQLQDQSEEAQKGGVDVEVSVSKQVSSSKKTVEKKRG